MLELEGRNGKGGVRQHRRPRCQMHRRLLLPRHQHLPDLILFWRKEKEGYGEEQICEISREADGRYVRIIRVSEQTTAPSVARGSKGNVRIMVLFTHLQVK